MDTCCTIPLHRRWHERLFDRLGEAWARFRARRDVDDVLELDEATLRDMGMPLWMQEEARARRERIGDAGPGRFY
ncbi:MAG: hypothetical protein AB7U92_02245 [Piscinibacter sp.]|uniref:hypothetical protein n=1 Tax=Piscinibacter sp. TaxID=1903157 RepID=UPI003D0A9E52